VAFGNIIKFYIRLSIDKWTYMSSFFWLRLVCISNRK